MIDNLLKIKDLRNERLKKKIIKETNQDSFCTDSLIDKYQSHFAEMVQMLNSEDPDDIEESLQFFRHYLCLSKDQQLTEHFLKYANALGTIINLFLNSEYPVVIEEALHLLYDIMVFVPIDLNPSIVKLVAQRVVYLFTFGIFSLALLLLDFISLMCNNNQNFGNLILALNGFDEAIDLLMGELYDVKKLILKECRAFYNVIKVKFDEIQIPQVTRIIDLFFNYDYDESRRYAIKMLKKLLEYGLDIDQYPIFIESIIKCTVFSNRTIRNLLKMLMQIKSENYMHLILCEIFINNLAFHLTKDRCGIKSNIIRFFRKMMPFYRPKINDLIVAMTIMTTGSSFKDKKQSFLYIRRLCEGSLEFSLELGQIGFLIILSNSIGSSDFSCDDAVLDILARIGHASATNGIDLRNANGFSMVAERLEEVANDPDIQIDQAKIRELMNFYYLANEAE